jgi:hypothetical protein
VGVYVYSFFFVVVLRDAKSIREEKRRV